MPQSARTGRARLDSYDFLAPVYRLHATPGRWAKPAEECSRASVCRFNHATSSRANELVQPHGTYARRIDVALGVGAHPFCERDPRISREIRDKSLHGAIARAPNTDTALYPWVGFLV